MENVDLTRLSINGNFNRRKFRFRYWSILICDFIFSGWLEKSEKKSFEALVNTSGLWEDIPTRYSISKHY
jgi:hypothetical protein